MNPECKLYYWPGRNFGDLLSPMLVSAMCGCRVKFCGFYRADMVAIGSLLNEDKLFCMQRDVLTFKGMKQYAKKYFASSEPLKVWGTGLVKNVDEGKKAWRLRALRCYSVRGPLTLRELRATGVIESYDPVAIGDPGLLFPLLLTSRPSKKFQIGIVPHFKDLEAGKKLFRLLACRGLKVTQIDVRSKSPLSVVEKIAECEHIVSSSLHGLITADALRIPNRQVLFSDYGIGWENAEFKFRDYCEGVHKQYNPITDIRLLMEDPVSALEKSGGYALLDLHVLRNSQIALLRSFPYGLSEEWRSKLSDLMKQNGTVRS